MQALLCLIVDVHIVVRYYHSILTREGLEDVTQSGRDDLVPFPRGAYRPLMVRYLLLYKSDFVTFCKDLLANLILYVHHVSLLSQRLLDRSCCINCLTQKSLFYVSFPFRSISLPTCIFRPAEMSASSVAPVASIA